MSSPEPVVLEVGAYTGPRLRAALATFVLAASVALLAGVLVDERAATVPLLALGVVLALVAVGIGVAWSASRGSRLVLDPHGITWDAGEATWQAEWTALSGIGLSVLRSRRRGGSAFGELGGERVIRVLMAFRADDPDADSRPLRRLRTTDEPAPWTHRMPIASRGDWAAQLDDALARFAGERYAGATIRDARGRVEEPGRG